MHEKQTESPSNNQAVGAESTLDTHQTDIPSGEVENASMQKARTQTLNDLFRTTFIGGKVVLTRGVHDLGNDTVQTIVKKVQQFDTFTEDNDPYGEHDFGIIKHGDDTLYWKIDYYNQDLSGGSENPADPEVTTRVLTIMQRYEY